MGKNFDELFRDIVVILRRDYAGQGLAGPRLDPRYYNTAIGQAWHDNKLDELLFFRFVNQMLACTGDRHLRLSMRPTDGYAPWSPGFFTRRYGDALYVTAVAGEDRLSPGDKITAVNGGSPAAQRAAIQKNFFYADTPEREDWNGLLKMADYIDVEHSNGRAERLELRRLPPAAPEYHCVTRELADARILDLRNVSELDDDGVLELLPLVCREAAPLSKLIDTDIQVNYTRFNCLVKAAGLQGVSGADAYISELAAKSGRGFLPESTDGGEIIPGRAGKTVVVLTDTWTRDGAETLALAAKRAGAVLIGRPTLGTIDLCGDVTYELDERYALTWPTAVTQAALDGKGVFCRGVEPDIYVPWTPEECGHDAVMDAACAYLDGSKQYIVKK